MLFLRDPRLNIDPGPPSSCDFGIVSSKIQKELEQEIKGDIPPRDYLFLELDDGEEQLKEDERKFNRRLAHYREEEGRMAGEMGTESEIEIWFGSRSYVLTDASCSYSAVLMVYMQGKGQ